MVAKKFFNSFFPPKQNLTKMIISRYSKHCIKTSTAFKLFIISLLKQCSQMTICIIIFFILSFSKSTTILQEL